MTRFWQAKLKAAAIHGALTLLVAAASATLVFAVWYPQQLAWRLGGAELLLLVMAVEVSLGPLMSLVIYNINKPRSELIRDYLIVGLIQFSALGYGLHSTFIARPVFHVFTVDRWEWVSALELDQQDLVKPYDSLPWLGPIQVCARLPEDAKERSDILLSALKGKDVQLMPRYYHACEAGEIAAKTYADKRLQWLLKAVGVEAKYQPLLPAEPYTWLPVKSRMGNWIEVYPGGNLERGYSVDLDPFELSLSAENAQR